MRERPQINLDWLGFHCSMGWFLESDGLGCSGPYALVSRGFLLRVDDNSDVDAHSQGILLALCSPVLNPSSQSAFLPALAPPSHPASIAPLSMVGSWSEISSRMMCRLPPP